MDRKHEDEDRVIIRFDNEEGDETEEPVIDLFSEEDESPRPFPSGQESVVSDEPEEEKEGSLDEAEKMRLSFDRYGRRISQKKKKKSQYGKRKNAPKATTKVVQNDTIARREYEAAKERSRQRAERREAKEAHEKKIRERERRERRRSLLRTGAFGLGSLLILVVMAWYTTRLKTIDVSPLPDGYTKEEIITASGLKTGRSIVFQDLSEAKNKIEQDAYLRANLKYSFPSKITIALEKRVPAACVRWGPQNEYIAIIDSSGIVLNAEAETTGGLIIAEGMSVTTAQNGKALGELTDIQVASLIRILSKLEELDLLKKSPRLTRIDMSELMSISMSTEGTNYQIEIGDTSNLDTKLILLQKHWSEVMDKALQYTEKGSSTVTIYLYSKGGISISPFEPGYYTQMENVTNYSLPSSNAEETPSPQTPDPDAPATETPTPAPTPMPHQGGAFTG